RHRRAGPDADGVLESRRHGGVRGGPLERHAAGPGAGRLTAVPAGPGREAAGRGVVDFPKPVHYNELAPLLRSRDEGLLLFKGVDKRVKTARPSIAAGG